MKGVIGSCFATLTNKALIPVDFAGSFSFLISWTSRVLRVHLNKSPVRLEYGAVVEQAPSMEEPLEFGTSFGNSVDFSATPSLLASFSAPLFRTLFPSWVATPRLMGVQVQELKHLGRNDLNLCGERFCWGSGKILSGLPCTTVRHRATRMEKVISSNKPNAPPSI